MDAADKQLLRIIAVQVAKIKIKVQVVKHRLNCLEELIKSNGAISVPTASPTTLTLPNMVAQVGVTSVPSASASVSVPIASANTASTTAATTAKVTPTGGNSGTNNSTGDPEATDPPAHTLVELVGLGVIGIVGGLVFLRCTNTPLQKFATSGLALITLSRLISRLYNTYAPD